MTLAGDGALQTETIFFYAGEAGARNFKFSVEPLPGEENLLNNAMSRQVSVSGERRKILYVEGEPRWEYKFIRRAEDDDKTVQVASMLRTTENKIYRQGISDPKELGDGFPSRAEDLFQYQGIILGSVEAGYFTPTQQELLREFVDRRGGGVLFLGGRFSLSDGGWAGVECDRPAADVSAGGHGDVSSRSGDGGVDGGWRGQPYREAGGRSGEECRPLEEADVHERLPGRWESEAGSYGAGEPEDGAAQTAAADFAELRTGADGGDGDVGDVALADERGAGGHGA